MLIFQGDYDKSKFYSIMGKFFAERTYRKIMPYLVNDENTTWNIEIVDNKVSGFISYIEKSSKIHIGYCYTEACSNVLMRKLIKSVLKKFPDKEVYVEIEKVFDKSEYLHLGFETYKETTNYWFLKKVQNENL